MVRSALSSSTQPPKDSAMLTGYLVSKVQDETNSYNYSNYHF